MKTKLLTLFSLLVLLLVSTAALADGRPTGIRIGRAAAGGGNNVEIDVTVTDTDYTFGGTSSIVWLGNVWTNNAGYNVFRAYASPAFDVPLPWGIEWGGGSYVQSAPLFGPPGGPWQGAFSHTYAMPGTYTIRVGDLTCCNTTVFPVNTGNVITGYIKYYIATFLPTTISSTFQYTYTNLQALAITATTTVTTGTSIPTMNIYGLLALSFVLVGAGLLLVSQAAT